ncbi:MAG: histidine kinase [Methanomicrobiales archaeon HGW-Methanomicrobiales-2]|jgi:PAS domain S-box-containing protein|nr:MAG: histidine kinase [Methanomicrobiales archaeon HGW-Methanomicrobiales-2]
MQEANSADSKDSRGRHTPEQTAPAEEEKAERSGMDTLALCQELEMHRANLELQNAELRQTQEQLRASEEEYRDLYEFAPVGYLTLDGEGRIRQVNLTGSALLHVERASLVQMRFQTFVAPASLPAFREFLARMAESGEKERCELEVVNPGRKKSLWLIAEGRSQGGAGGADCRYRVALTDITEKRQLEQSLRERDATKLARVHRDLESAHREANLYLDILTHDMGNTENVSNLYAELLADSVEGEAAGYVASLKKSVNKSIEILGTVSKIRRIHAGPPLLRPTDLDTVIRAEIAHFPDIPLSYEGVPRRVLADDLLPEVFTNLIGNAVKHGGPGVAVTVRTEEENGFVRVTVADTGRGVPDDQKEEIFHRYERKQRGVGEGLGLYLVQILIGRYGGRIRVEDRVPGRPEEGAAFVFTLREAGDDESGRSAEQSP